MALTAAEASKQLADLEEKRRAQAGDQAALTFAKDVKQSLMFQYDWGELLSAAPLCISLMGSCYVAATSPKATGMSLKECEPQGGFKKIQNPELRACLIQISDTGRFAFIEAEKKMDLISSTSGSIGTYLSRIGQYLAMLPDRSAAMQLDDNIENLKEGSDKCLKYAQDIENKFKSWLELVCEVHQVTVAKDEKTSIVQKETEIKIGGVNIEAELTDKAASDAEQAAKDMKENMVKSREMFEKAADAIPSPLEAVGIQFVASLAQAATGAISQGMPAMMNRYAGTNMKGPNGAGGNNTGGGRGQRKNKTLGQADTSISDVDDPAYRVAVQANVMATLLSTILGVGTTTGVDWEHLDPVPGNGQDNRNGLTVIQATLNFIQDSTKWTQGFASMELKAAIAKLLEVTKALKAEVAKDNSLMAKKPAADSPIVAGWQKDATDGKAVMTRMTATLNSLPGGAPGSAPLTGNQPRSSSSGEADPMGTNSALASAQEKARLTEAAYTSAQANYQKSVENRSKVQQDLAKIKANLSSLSLQKASLEEIKKVLMQCIGTLIQMKAQITNLVLFFSSLSAMIEHVVKENVKDFLRQVGTAQKCIIAGVSLLDLSRQELYTTILMTQAYFSLFRSIADMYKSISVEYIQPGVRMCDEMSKTVDNPNSVQKRLADLNEFTEKAQEAVEKKVSEAQAKTTKSLSDRVKGAEGLVQMLPPPPPATLNAIQQGNKQITDAVSDGIAANTNTVGGGINTDDI